MKKWLIRILAGLVILAGLGFLFREKIFMALIRPSADFANDVRPPAPDYKNDDHWAALPGREDRADFEIGALDDRQAGAPVDVFYVHPTTFIDRSGWNAPIDNERAREIIDEFVMKGQASAFNGCCQVYAPLYRQATFYSFIDETGQGKAARAFAYEDVARAFDEFAARTGQRPFILAGHSQGADHVARLLEEKISGTPHLSKMVAAYPIGFGINAAEMAKAAPDIPVCSVPDQTACYISWNAAGPRAEPWPDQVGAVCVNPLSWRADAQPVPASVNLGALGLEGLGDGSDQIVPGFADAQCTNDRLLVTEMKTAMFEKLPMNMGTDNYHILDFALFYANIRENAMMRAAAFLAKEAAGN